MKGDPLRVAFIGASGFGLRCLNRLVRLEDCTVVGVITAPEHFRISYAPGGVRNVLHVDVAETANVLGVPLVCIQEGMRDPGLLETVRAWGPQAFVVAGWYHMIPRDWRTLAPAYGLHASILPDYAGGAPLVWAIINGERETGITLFEMGDGVDDGPILGQKRTPIEPDETIAELYARIETLGLDLLTETIPALALGVASPTPQDLEGRRVFPQRSPEDGAIDWTQPVRRVHDFVRAQTRPYPGAFSIVEGEKVTFWRAAPLDSHSETNPPGTVALRDGHVVVHCGSGALAIHEAEVRGELLKGKELADRLGIRAPETVLAT